MLLEAETETYFATQAEIGEIKHQCWVSDCKGNMRSLTRFHFDNSCVRLIKSTHPVAARMFIRSIVLIPPVKELIRSKVPLPGLGFLHSSQRSHILYFNNFF